MSNCTKRPIIIIINIIIIIIISSSLSSHHHHHHQSGLDRPVSALQFFFVQSSTIHHYFGHPVVEKANKSDKYGQRPIYSAQ